MTEQIQAFSGWDKGLDYETEKARIENKIMITRARRDKMFYSILLILLVNGARVGEAVSCGLEYAKDGQREHRVRVEKRKDRYLRLMIVPEVVRKYPQVRMTILASNDSYSSLIDSTKKFCQNKLGYNTHALRYAFIGHYANQLTPQALAKLTGHKTLDLVLHYTQSVIAETMLRKLIK